MLKFLQRFDINITSRSYWVGALLFGLFIMSYPFSFIFKPAFVLLNALGFVVALDLIFLLLPAAPVTGSRNTQSKWSLGDYNKVNLQLQNQSYFTWYCEIIDELPIELQVRDFALFKKLKPREIMDLEYSARPTTRGLLHFGFLNVIIKSPLGFVERRLRMRLDTAVGVYPSFQQMKKYSLYSVNNISRYYGVKKMRRIGHSYEFEQIKDYVRGDDLRHVNWKATSRSQALKTNHFIEEKAQPVYCIIDKSRNMNMAFDGMSILDYSINASLVISNVAIQKGDKAGLVTFSDKVGTAMRAENGPNTLRKIVDGLYNQKYRETEPDFGFLFNALNRVIVNRSLLFLFTNFDTINALERALPVLRRINYRHLLIVVIFENAEIEKYAYEASSDIREVFTKTVARQWLDNKRQVAVTLNKHGIQTIITNTGNLSIDVLNKYIELKAKGLV